MTDQADFSYIWAGWREHYVSKEAGRLSGSIFENLESSGEPDENTLILWRGETCFAVLNLYPYCTGHLMVLPKRAVSELDQLEPHETTELWKAVQQAVVALKGAYKPEGINIGMNLGRVAGAGIPEHLHVHCVPRWSGDTNFMTTISNTRVLPESLTETWRKLQDAWPQS